MAFQRSLFLTMAHIQICICVIVINRLCYNAIVQMGFARIPLSTRGRSLECHFHYLLHFQNIFPQNIFFSDRFAPRSRAFLSLWLQREQIEREGEWPPRRRRLTRRGAPPALKPRLHCSARARLTACRPTAAFPPYAPPHSFPNRAGAAASPRPASIPLGRLLNSRWRRRILSPSRIIIIPQPSSDFFERSTLRIIIIRL